MESLKQLYKELRGYLPEAVVPLAGAGSARRYFRLFGAGGPLIGVIGTDFQENRAFVRLSEAFAASGLPVPQVLRVSADGMRYLQTDLGDLSLFSLLGSGQAHPLVEQVMRELPKMQTCSHISEDMLYPVKEMNLRHIRGDLHYFKYCFLKAAGVEFDEEALEDDLDALAEAVLDTPKELTGWMLRDCQSRNVMVSGNRPYFIDYQSARRGPLLYDVASFLWQAKARFSPEFRRQMADVYMAELQDITGVNKQDMERSLQTMVWFRTLQVLGAYGLRGLTERKAHFLTSISAALGNVRQMLESGHFARLKELRRCLKALTGLERFKNTEEPGKLTVTIFSFSYKKGYPDDFSGNGGGFMFDCRAMHNPGRYDQYKPLTGRDLPVIEFLEARGEVQSFLRSAAELVEPAVSRYVQRGFTGLQVGFGCTGGRHRSVYCAEHLARIIRDKFPDDKVNIRVIHREQNIDYKL